MIETEQRASRAVRAWSRANRGLRSAERGIAQLREIAAGPVMRSITVNRAPEEVQRFWHDYKNPLRFLTHDRSGTVSAEAVDHGVVRFVPAPGGRGTEVHVELRHDLRAIVSKLVGGGRDAHELDHDLRQFKQILETGEAIK
ncbi:MAG: hypothetical protein JWM74_884 [Myxococcaceae bacterium]|nr:hypothetical protein [Myxococcaceae bacterium]